MISRLGMDSRLYLSRPMTTLAAEGDESVIFTLAPDLAYDINPIARTLPRLSMTTIAADSGEGDSGAGMCRMDRMQGRILGLRSEFQVGKSSTSGNNRIAYLKFDLTLTPATITSAKLQIFGKLNSASPKNVPVGVYSVANTSWTESGINFNNKPALSSARSRAPRSGSRRVLSCPRVSRRSAPACIRRCLPSAPAGRPRPPTRKRIAVPRDRASARHRNRPATAPSAVR